MEHKIEKYHFRNIDLQKNTTFHVDKNAFSPLPMLKKVTLTL